METTPQFSINRLAVIGVGLIGGSLARALREQQCVAEIVGCGRGRENLERALELGVIDRYFVDPAEAVSGADMVVVATNLRAIPLIFAAIAPALENDAVVTDVGSAKSQVIAAAERYLGAHLERFVPGHPIAGTEHSGVDASFAELFVDHRVILTPLAVQDKSALDRVSTMWRATGASVSEMDAGQHDRILAATSHLPHMLAFALVDCLAGSSDTGAIFDFAAGGFRDFTRIASSNPPMWRDIALENRDALLEVMARFDATWSALRKALEVSDEKALVELFERAKSARDGLSLPRHSRDRE